MKPLVSVIIPTFNRLPLLKEAIASVKAQTYKEMELIIVDDGSTDNTSAYFKNSPWIYIKLNHTGMAGHVRNTGVKAASGTYIAFLDSDDLWHPDKIAKQVDFLTGNPELILCHTREIWNRKGKIISQAGQRHEREGYIFNDALVKCIIGPSTVIIKRQYFLSEGMFRDDLEIAEDYELWLRICAKYRVGYIDEPLVIKRAGHAGQLSEKYGKIEHFRIMALKINIDNNIFTGEQQQYAVRELIRKLEIYAKGCLKRNKSEEWANYRKIRDFYEQKMSAEVNSKQFGIQETD